jgi:hypothetical protein
MPVPLIQLVRQHTYGSDQEQQSHHCNGIAAYPEKG